MSKKLQLNKETLFNITNNLDLPYGGADEAITFSQQITCTNLNISKGPCPKPTFSSACKSLQRQCKGPITSPIQLAD